MDPRSPDVALLSVEETLLSVGLSSGEDSRISQKYEINALFCPSVFTNQQLLSILILGAKQTAPKKAFNNFKEWVDNIFELA